MISVDTNVIVRLLVGDDRDQAQRARALFALNPIGIGKTVLLETECVLRSAYGFSAAEIRRGFEQLLGLPQVTLADQAVIVPALAWYREGMDFADALHLSEAIDADSFATFDRALKACAERLKGTPPIIAP
ncbi:MAG: type II toxin-antitoxin system VapC family toxin [Hyphomicrobiaceae bacterium]